MATIYDEKAMHGISDGATSSGNSITTVLYTDKDGNLKTASSMQTNFVAVAIAIKMLWAMGKNPSIVLIVNEKTTNFNEIESLIYTIKKPDKEG